LSVFNLHVNRMPISGEVVRVEHREGLHLNAMNPQSAERNEQSIITVRGEGIEVTFKQIDVWQDGKYIPCACTSTFCRVTA
jgi:phosphatidylserine decarboxylase